MPEPTCDAEVVRPVALALLEEYAPSRPVRLLGVRVAGLTGAEGPGDEPGGGGGGEAASAGRAPSPQLALPW